MGKLVSAVSTGQGLLLALALIGCATAALITGHLTSGDYMTVVGVTVGIGGAVTAAHVGGTVANAGNATSSVAQPADASTAAPTTQAAVTQGPVAV